MSKPYIHAKSSAKKYGGKPEDYIAIHEWFDQTKAFLPDQRHRALLHNSFGIFLCAQVFGNTIKNSDGKTVSVRDIGEQHVLEDFGGKFIPTPQDYLQEIEYKDWMQNGKDYPPSFQKVDRSRRKKKDEKVETGNFVAVPSAELNITDGFNQWRAATSIKPSGLDVVIDGGAGEAGGCLPIGKDVVDDGSRDNLPSSLPGADVVYDGSRNIQHNPLVD